MSIIRRQTDSVRRRLSTRTATSFQPRCCALEQRALLSILTVMNTNDSGDGSLRAAVASAQAGDTIVFAPELDGQTITLTSGSIADAGKSLTIQGPGSDLLTVSGNAQSGIFSFQPADSALSPFDVDVSGLTLTDAAHAHAIEDTNASLSLTGDQFVSNQNGGVLASKVKNFSQPNFTLAIDVANCQFTDNHTPGFGGALFVSGVVLNISDSGFSGNTATGLLGSVGGALYLANTTSTNTVTTIDSSQFVDNMASLGGGAIHNNGGMLTVSASSFAQNQARFGGAIDNEWIAPLFGFPLPTGSLTVQNCAFLNNQARGRDASASTFATQGTGGAIEAANANGPITISNSDFERNIARGGDNGTKAGLAGLGGAFDTFTSAQLRVPLPLSFSQNSFLENQAVGGQGGGGGGNAIGGALSLLGFMKATVSDSTFFENSAQAGSGGAGSTRAPFVLSPNTAVGGAIAKFGTSLAVSGSTFEQNSAIGGAGGAGLAGGPALGGAILNSGNMTLTDSQLAGNQALGGHGGDAAGTAVNGGTGGQSLGGAIANINGRTATLSHVHFAGNLAQGGDGGTGVDSGHGGNGGEALGGAMFNEAESQLIVSFGRFNGNGALGGAGGNGGATGNGGSGGDGIGGAIESGLQGAPPFPITTLTVSDSEFSGNRAIGGMGGAGISNGTDGQGLGGAIAILSDPAVITTSRFEGNKASTAGDDVFGPFTS